MVKYRLARLTLFNTNAITLWSFKCTVVRKSYNSFSCMLKAGNF